jgi:hypothetical protein
MANTCNPSYTEGRYQEDHSLRPAWAKSQQDPTSTNKKLGAVGRTCHPNYTVSVNRSVTVQTGPSINADPI